MSLRTLYDEASLWMTPSGYEDGKLFSELPTDGSGDFTFSRGSNLAATRVGPTGLIEKGRENHLLQSNNFSNSTWDNYLGAGGSITGGQLGYDGSNDAWLIEKQATTYRRIQQSVSVSGVWTMSVYAKAGTTNIFRFRDNTSANMVEFDLFTGIAINTGSNAAIDVGMENVGNDWYRCYWSHSASISTMQIYVGWAESDSVNIYIQDAQLEIGLAATEVISTGATTGKAGLLENEPRLDYSGGASCPALLLEPSRTNLIVQSEYYEGLGWSSQQTLETLENVTNPEGINATYKVCATASNVNHYLERAPYTGATSGVDYVFSFFAKAEDSDFVQVATSTGFAAKYQNFNLSNGTFGNGDANAFGYTSTIEAVGTNGWYRISVKATTTSTNARFLIVPILSDISARNPIFLGNGTTGFYMWGAQLEQASYPTSYIPNNSGGTITRSQDSCTGAGDADTFNDSEGVLYAEISTLSLSDFSERLITISDTSNNSYLRIQYGGTPGTIYLLIYINGVKVADIRASSLDTTNKHKVAIRYGSAGYSGFVDGVLIETDAYAGNFVSYPLNSLDFFQWKGNVNQVLVFNEALSDAECIALTTI